MASGASDDLLRARQATAGASVIAVQHALAYGRTAMFGIVPWYLGKAVGEAVKAGAWEAVLVIGVALVPVASWLHRTFMTWAEFHAAGARRGRAGRGA
jgi:hypothetical protein